MGVRTRSMRLTTLKDHNQYESGSGSSSAVDASSDSDYEEEQHDSSDSETAPIINRPLHQPRRVALGWLRQIRQSRGYKLQNIRSHVGICFLCNQIKTLSQQITFGDNVLKCGRNCAQRVVLACPKQRQSG